MQDDVQLKFKKDLDKVLLEVRTMLVEKNRKYGDSVLTPKRVFSRASLTEQVRVRMDDKVSRLMSAQGDDEEDAMKDLLGYLIIFEIAKLREKENEDAA